MIRAAAAGGAGLLIGAAGSCYALELLGAAIVALCAIAFIASDGEVI